VSFDDSKRFVGYYLDLKAVPGIQQVSSFVLIVQVIQDSVDSGCSVL
jgi:hypothetical protein